ncbi:DNA cytosine methyltransferase [Methylobacterium sp. 1030]|uniref:DNA cytosine methyltransferase n=1 Tax=Methylobacterium sp. 1030 TaxID=3156404 RepID=UPI003391DA18
MTARRPLTVVDLFSGAGGMSAGFARREGFRVVGAVDIEQGKPCEGAGATACNSSYALNTGIDPVAEDLFALTPEALRTEIRRRTGFDLKPGTLGVLSACPPCTDFSRAKPTNHVSDGGRNALTGRVGEFVDYFRPRHIVMENAREFLQGKFAHHAEALCASLRRSGYDVKADIRFLTDYGLPQIRERALIVASRVGEARSLDDLWAGLSVKAEALTVRSALARLAVWQGQREGADPADMAPGLRPDVARRLHAVPHDGGSWMDVARIPGGLELLTPAIRHRWAIKDLGSHPDVYGRMWWDRPAPTIKRECSHVGNGRYVHPTADRLLTLREMASLNGFPFDYRFAGALASRYRQVGDAVPPVISYQVSALVQWMETGVRPGPEKFVLANSVLAASDISKAQRQSVRRGRRVAPDAPLLPHVAAE